MNDSTPSNSRKVWGWLLVILVPLVLGILTSLLVRQPVVGIIQVKDAIYSNTAQDMITQIRYARENPQVRAVVLVINSPGGTVSDTESVYLELAALREVEGMAASGAYYLSVGSDYVMAKSSSEVGNIGIIGYTPSTPQVYDSVYSTGPYKLWGYPKDKFIRELEALKLGFYQAVKAGRGDKLKASPEVVLSGQIWLGSEALQLGLIDELGTQSQAFDKAASMAQISNYAVKDLRELAGIPEPQVSSFYGMTESGAPTHLPLEAGIYLLYIPELEGQQ
jgi:protease-4